MKLKVLILCFLLLTLLLSFKSNFNLVSDRTEKDSSELNSVKGQILVLVKNAANEEFFSKVFLKDAKRNIVLDPFNVIPEGRYRVIASSNNNILFQRQIEVTHL